MPPNERASCPARRRRPFAAVSSSSQLTASAPGADETTGVAQTASVDARLPFTLDDATILRRFGLEPDPVIEAYKLGVDRTLLRQNLCRSLDERLQTLAAAERLAAESTVA